MPKNYKIEFKHKVTKIIDHVIISATTAWEASNLFELDPKHKKTYIIHVEPIANV